MLYLVKTLLFWKKKTNEQMLDITISIIFHTHIINYYISWKTANIAN